MEDIRGEVQETESIQRQNQGALSRVRKLFALGAGLIVLLGGLIVVSLQKNPEVYNTIFIAFSGCISTLVGGFMWGNRSEHIDFGGAMGAVGKIVSAVLPGSQATKKE